MENSSFKSRYIVRDDMSYDYIPLGNFKYFDFAELQKAQEKSWHSRPYEYAFVASNMRQAYNLNLIKLDRVLDLACGINHPGYMAIANMFIVKKVVALDLDSRLLTNGMDHPKVEKIIGDAADTSFADDSFDAIVCVSALEHMSDWQDVIQEMYRLLKVGGMAFVTLDISVDPEKTLQHNVDGKTPDDYKVAFKNAGLAIFGSYDSHMPETVVDTINSKYPLVKDESEFKPGQHRALKAFKMILRKEKK